MGQHMADPIDNSREPSKSVQSSRGAMVERVEIVQIKSCGHCGDTEACIMQDVTGRATHEKCLIMQHGTRFDAGWPKSSGFTG